MKRYYDYNYMKNLFSNHKTFKTSYVREINKLFKEEFTKRSRWGLCGELEGVLTEEGGWHSYNNINTHANILYFFCKWFQKDNEFLYDDFASPKFSAAYSNLAIILSATSALGVLSAYISGEVSFNTVLTQGTSPN